MTSKREIREWMKTTREALREVERALTENRLDDAADLATDAAGYAGEVENSAEKYAFENARPYRSGDS